MRGWTGVKRSYPPHVRILPFNTNQPMTAAFCDFSLDSITALHSFG